MPEYTSEKFKEPIEVIVLFTGGLVRPLRFLWKGRSYKIDWVRYRWKKKEKLPDSEKSYYRYHYAVCCGTNDVFHLSYVPYKQLWRIEAIHCPYE